MAAVLAALVLGATHIEALAPDAPGPETLDAARPRIVELLRAGILTLEPNAAKGDIAGRATPFDGSYDWHSSVIAHWALLVHARTHADEELDAWLLQRLTTDVVTEELASVEARNRRRRVTYPYDEGWLLMLLAELARRESVDPEPLETMRSALEARLLETLESARFPENFGAPKGTSRYCGFYRSTLFLYLLLRWSDPVRADKLARLDAWRDEVLEPKRKEIEAIHGSHGYDFLSIPALLALVDRLEGELAPSYSPPEFTGWPDSVVIATVHVLGLELSRVWPCAVDAGRGAAEAEVTYRRRVDSLLAREELWAEDFPACAHWIPQYLFIGEWLREGRP